MLVGTSAMKNEIGGAQLAYGLAHFHGKSLGETVQTGETRHERRELLSRLTNDPF